MASSSRQKQYDTAHNKEGLTYVVRQLKEEIYQKIHIVLGMVSDKNVENRCCLFFHQRLDIIFVVRISQGGRSAKIKRIWI